MLRPPLPPMLAKAVDALPPPRACRGGCRYEPKFDGWRCLAFRDAGGAYLQSRGGRALAGYFPDVAEAVRAAVPAGAVLDGELVVWDQDEINFGRLRERIAAGARLGRLVREHPAHYVIFDLLQAPPGHELLRLPLRERRAHLADLLTGVAPPVTLCPHTGDLHCAGQWASTWTTAGVEGVVAKGPASRYLPGRRGWLKYRHTTVTEAIIGGVTGTLAGPETLLLGRHDPAGTLRFTGQSHPLTTVQRRELAPLLRPPARAHPWPQPLPAGWLGYFERADPLPYQRVAPLLVAEIRVDAAFERRRWRHRVHHQRVRVDLPPSAVPVLQP